MKRCPSCNQTFEEDWLSFCTQDGTTLFEEPVASSEPPPTIMAPPPAPFDQPAPWNAPSPNVARSPPPWQPYAPSTPEWIPPPPPAHFPPAPSKGLATAAMVIGIISVTVGWLCLGPVPGIAAIIMGAVALSQMKKSPERTGGRQAAWTGIITGGITVVIYVGFLIFYVIMFAVANA